MRHSLAHYAQSMLLVTILAASTAHAASVASDALARSEFDVELTIRFEKTDIVGAFRLLASVTRIPFVLDFPNDPALSLSLDAKDMSVRAILTSLAETYGLEYAMGGEGLIVHRKGTKSATSPITLGAWPVHAGSLYDLSLSIRDARGNEVSSPRVVAQINQRMQFKQGIHGDAEVLVIDEERGIAEPVFLPRIVLNIFPRRESDAGLEVLMEVVTSRVLSANRYVEEHSTVERTLPRGETLLFRTEEGYEITLLDWSHRQN